MPRQLNNPDSPSANTGISLRGRISRQTNLSLASCRSAVHIQGVAMLLSLSNYNALPYHFFYDWLDRARITQIVLQCQCNM